MNYSIYSKDTGRILRVVTCAADHIEMQCDASAEDYISGAYDDSAFQIVNGEVVPVDPPTVSLSEIKASLETCVQKLLNDGARSRGYDNIVSACSYAGAPNPFQQESIDFLTWRSGVWTHCYQALADVEAGIRPVPTEEELLAELPALVFTTN